MSRRLLLLIFYCFAVVFGIVVFIRTAGTLERVGAVVMILGGLAALLGLVLDQRRRRRGQWAGDVSESRRDR